jgi:thiol-disulfide isomerase/thioredoxin
MVTKSAFLAFAVGLAVGASAQTLKVGDDAPALSVEKFVSGKETAKLERGTPYVIDFWATWCGPCIRSIPHLAETQEKYEGAGLRVIGVGASERADSTEERLAKLASFVEDRDDINYAVAYDDDRSMMQDWMRPAGRNTIPTAFVVDREGKIAFIGNPASEQSAFDAAVQKVAAPSGSSEPESEPDRPHALMTGDKAPKLAISEWVKGEPVNEFEKGQVYVVEFWATWCGPCIAGMPHLSELQKEYGDKVKIIGVNAFEDPAAVEPFMKDRGNELMGYRVAIEEKDDENDIRNGVMAKKWMTAAGRNGIPSAFVVDQQGRIAWQGHPASMDEPLEKIVAGEWDIEAEKKRAKEAAVEAQRRAAAAAADPERQRIQRLRQEYTQAMESDDIDAAIAALDKLIATEEKPPAAGGDVVATTSRSMYSGLKYRTLLQAERHDDAYAFAREWSDRASDDPIALNQIAWFIVDPEARPEKQDLDLALKAAQRADELTEHKDPTIMDTLACVHWDRGEKEKALEIQTRAVELAQGTPVKAELEGRLEMFKKELGRN